MKDGKPVDGNQNIKTYDISPFEKLVFPKVIMVENKSKDFIGK